MTGITFLGHASFRFESNSGTVVFFDPWLDNNPTATWKVADVDRADLVISSHGHNDHIADAFNICQKTGARFVGNYELCVVAAAHGLELGTDSMPVNPGGSVQFKDVTITMTQAFHSQSMSPNLAKGAPADGDYFRPDGTVGGFVLRFDDGVTIYDAADTCLFSDMQLIGQMYGPQIAILPVGGKYTMGVREAARAASLVRPDVVIPCHYGDTMGQPADMDELAQGIEFLAAGTKLAPLAVGDTLHFTPAQFHISN